MDQFGNVIGIIAARLGDIATLKVTGSLPQNLSYALKGSIVTAFLQTMPEMSAKLKAPRPTTDRPIAEVEAEVEQAIVLVTVY